MPSTTNGIGTKYCGERDYHPDGSWITTLWFTLFFIPIFPIRSARIAWARDKNDLGPLPRSAPQGRVEIERKWAETTEVRLYKLISKESLSFRQVLYFYSYMIGWLLIIPVVIRLLSYILPNNMITKLLVAVIIIFYSVLPWLLRKVARRKVGVDP